MVHHRYDRYVQFATPLLLRTKVPLADLSVPLSALPVPCLSGIADLLHLPQRGIPIEVTVIAIVPLLSCVDRRRWCGLVRSGLKTKKTQLNFRDIDSLPLRYTERATTGDYSRYNQSAVMCDRSYL